MSSELGSHLPIFEKDLADQKEGVKGFLINVDWTPRKQISAGDEKIAPGAKVWRPSAVADIQKREEVSLIRIGKTLSEDPNLMSECANFVLLTIKRSLCLGFYLCRQYEKAAGILELRTRNTAGQLVDSEKTEFVCKQNTASAIAVFTAAAYLVWRLGSYKESEISAIQIGFPGLPEADLTTPVSALKCFLFYLGFYTDPEKAKLVKTDLAMARMAIKYGEAVMDEIRSRLPSLKYAEPFTQVSYQLEETDFIVSGFDAPKHVISTAEFKKVSFDEIVGNKAAKHAARRLASRLVAYDLRAKRNPFAELGSLQKIVMGFGRPGTGKTMLISATATEIERQCQMVGLPFVFWPLPENIISTFQGGSGERMADWMKRFLDDNRILFGAIDDGENNLENRTRQNVSAGVREVIGVFLRGTEGASAIWHDNGLLGIFTNLPEQIDPAVLSRVQARFPIDGARTLHDYLDQDYLWWRRIAEIDPEFIQMADLDGYEYMADQALVSSMAETQPTEELSDEVLRGIYCRTQKQFKGTDQVFFAALFVAVAEKFPFFSSRDVRNIQTAVQSRVMDFDLPEEWLENPELFYHKSYHEKVEILKDLMRMNMGRLSFAQIRLQETIRYLNAMASIANADRERRIGQRIESYNIEQSALSRVRSEPT